jgi:hypothetical protein
VLTVLARLGQAPTQAPTSPCRPLFTALDAAGLDSSLRVITANRCNSTLRLMRGGAYRLQREHSIASSVVITGAKAGSGVVLRPYTENYRHFNVTGTSGNLTLISITLADAFRNGSATVYGGSIYLAPGTRGRFVSVTFRNNTVQALDKAQGGALWSNADSVAFDGCTFVSNTASSEVVADGGGAYLTLSSSAGGVSLTKPSFINNTVETRSLVRGGASSRGGGLCVDASIDTAARVVINGGRFLGNQAFGRSTTGSVWGGAVHLAIPTAALEGVVFVGNHAYGSSSAGSGTVSAYGGAVYLSNPVLSLIPLVLTLRSLAFYNNSAVVARNGLVAGLRLGAGGGLYVLRCCSALAWNETIFLGNVASSPKQAFGGGAVVFNSVGTLGMDALTFQDNHARANGSQATSALGGGLVAHGLTAATASITFSNCTWTSNGAAMNNTAVSGTVFIRGGGLYGRLATVTFDRCSLLKNQVVATGVSASTILSATGGALGLYTTNAFLNRSTVVANSVVTAGLSSPTSCATGGGSWTDSSTLTVVGGTVLAANTASARGAVTCNQGGAVYVLGATAALRFLSGTVVEYSGSRAANTAYNDVVVSETTAVVQPTRTPSVAPSQSPTKLPSEAPTSLPTRLPSITPTQVCVGAPGRFTLEAAEESHTEALTV